MPVAPVMIVLIFMNFVFAAQAALVNRHMFTAKANTRSKTGGGEDGARTATWTAKYQNVPVAASAEGRQAKRRAHLDTTIKLAAGRCQNSQARTPALRSAAVPAASSRGVPAPCSLRPEPVALTRCTC